MTGLDPLAAPADARIAVIMTCHNRRDLTQACLLALRGQHGFRAEDLFLVDDGSDDGTGDMVRAILPGAHVIEGDGSLFWNGGMRLAWDTAANAGKRYDFYLWLNDDVILAEDALAMLVADADATVARDGAVIVAGAMHEPGDPQTITYGAQRRPDPRRRFRLQVMQPVGTPQPAVAVSGNVVLVSAAAHARLGNLTDRLVHIFGDLDYGFRAVAAGIPVVLASRVAGSCAANDDSGSAPRKPLFARIRAAHKQANKLHARDWRRFVALHAGPVERLSHWLAPYLRALKS
ncbi:glycosyltransferase family 2 protein [Croceicoccus ponticola]|uniref:glycosyltransferase family 2 protein n=1 Tax=Croceicoccus ponticola TaxID=2217664 RepID=UPI0013E3ACAF|nr:glycosyltransferase [Croceicoccus ponticola]